LTRKMLSETGRVSIEIRPAELIPRANDRWLGSESARVVFDGADEIR